jgi:hypothetical protein
MMLVMCCERTASLSTKEFPQYVVVCKYPRRETAERVANGTRFGNRKRLSREVAVWQLGTIAVLLFRIDVDYRLGVIWEAAEDY